MAHKNVLHQRNPFAIDRRPTMLKDFLNENSNSCSSSGLKSIPRQQPINQARNSNNPNITSKLLLPRSRSKAASTTLISSALHILMRAVKNIPFTAVKSPSFLPRSLSWGSKKSSSRKESQSQVQIIVRVKDIMRWTSFCDTQPLDFPSSPHHCTTATTITGSTSTTCSNSSSNGSSWCDSDFTSEFLPVDQECGENEVEVGGKKYLPGVGKDYSMEATVDATSYTAVGPQVEVLLCDEAEQHSPVSMLDFQFGEDDEEAFSSTFDQSIANVERTKEMLMQKIKHFESLAKLDPVNLDSWMSLEERTNFEEEEEEEEVHGIEERAMERLNYVKATSSTPESSCEANMEDKLLLDFFREEMSAQRNQTDYIGFNWEMVSKAKAWLSGEHDVLIEWGLEHKKEAFVKDMHKGGRWINKFEDEQEELALEIESAMSEYLVDELLVDLLLR